MRTSDEAATSVPKVPIIVVLSVIEIKKFGVSSLVKLCPPVASRSMSTLSGLRGRLELEQASLPTASGGSLCGRFDPNNTTAGRYRAAPWLGRCSLVSWQSESLAEGLL